MIVIWGWICTQNTECGGLILNYHNTVHRVHKRYHLKHGPPPSLITLINALKQKSYQWKHIIYDYYHSINNVWVIFYLQIYTVSALFPCHQLSTILHVWSWSVDLVKSLWKVIYYVLMRKILRHIIVLDRYL